MSKYTVDNAELKDEIVRYIDSCTFKTVQNKRGVWKKKIKSRGPISDKLGQMIKTIAEGLATKGNWRNYTWKQDFVSYGILIVLRYIHNFDYNKYDNAHGYVNMICYNAFLQYIQKEKQHSYIKQELYDKKDNVQDSWDQSIDYEELKDEEFL